MDVNRAQPHAPIRQRTFAFVTFAHSYEADACVFLPNTQTQFLGMMFSGLICWGVSIRNFGGSAMTVCTCDRGPLRRAACQHKIASTTLVLIASHSQHQE